MMINNIALCFALLRAMEQKLNRLANTPSIKMQFIHKNMKLNQRIPPSPFVFSLFLSICL